MKNIILIAVLLVSFQSNSQTLYRSFIDTNQAYWQRVEYPETDTLKCHFLEADNDSTFTWKTGFVIRKKGMIDFGKTSVTKEYLPICSGIVTSKLFYTDMRPVKKYAIQIIIKP